MRKLEEGDELICTIYFEGKVVADVAPIKGGGCVLGWPVYRHLQRKHERCTSTRDLRIQPSLAYLQSRILYL